MEPKIIPSGTTFTQLQAGGSSRHLEALVASNMPEMSSTRLQLLRYIRTGHADRVWNYLHQVVGVFSRGEPATLDDIRGKLTDIRMIFALLLQMTEESLGLVEANPGRFVRTASGIDGTKTTRVWDAPEPLEAP